MTYVKARLYEAFSIHVDEVVQGCGTTNNGNTARKCFQDPGKFATALELDPDIVKRISFILLAFKQKFFVDLDVLESYCNETYKLIYDTYPWVMVSPTVHKLLRHGPTIARKFPLTMAYYAEDASEKCNKLYRKNAKEHARQTSRKERLQDVFNYNIYLSDPLISLNSIDERMKQEKGALPVEFCQLFSIETDIDFE